MTLTALALVSKMDVDHYIATRVPSSESLLLGSRSAFWSDATAGQLSQVLGGLADVLEGLGPGDVLRVVGPDRLLVGLEAGSYHLVQTADGALGTVAGTDGAIVGQLRFERPAPGALHDVPGALFQLASVVTAQYYLHQIFQRLDAIANSIGDIRQRLQFQTRGQIKEVATKLDFVEARVLNGLPLRGEDRHSVDRAYEAIVGSIDTAAGPLAGHLDRVDHVLGGVERASVRLFSSPRHKGRFKNLLKAAQLEMRDDAVLLIAAYQQYLRGAHLKFIVADSDEAAGTRALVMEHFVTIRHHLADAAIVFGQLMERLSSDQINEAFKHQSIGPLTRRPGAVTRTFEECRGRVQPIEELLRRARDIPWPSSDSPVLLEARRGRFGAIEARCAVLNLNA